MGPPTTTESKRAKKARRHAPVPAPVPTPPSSGPAPSSDWAKGKWSDVPFILIHHGNGEVLFHMGHLEQLAARLRAERDVVSETERLRRRVAELEAAASLPSTSAASAPAPAPSAASARIVFTTEDSD